MKEIVSHSDNDSAAVRSRRRAVPLVVDAASIAIYILACTQPVFYRYVYPEGNGVDVLLFGWLGPLVWQFAWYANPLLWAAWVMTYRQRWEKAIILGVIAFCLGLSTFTMTELPSFSTRRAISGFGTGVYLWLGSMVVVVIGAAIAGYGRRRLSSRPIAQIIQLGRNRK